MLVVQQSHSRCVDYSELRSRDVDDVASRTSVFPSKNVLAPRYAVHGPNRTVKNDVLTASMSVINSPLTSFSPLARKRGLGSCWLYMTSRLDLQLKPGRGDCCSRSGRTDTSVISPTGVSSAGRGLVTVGEGLELVSESEIVTVVCVAGPGRVGDLGLLESESMLTTAERLIVRGGRGGGLSVDSESKSSASPRLDDAVGGGLALESESLEGILFAAGGGASALEETAMRSSLDSDSGSNAITR